MKKILFAKKIAWDKRCQPRGRKKNFFLLNSPRYKQGRTGRKISTGQSNVQGRQHNEGRHTNEL